MKTGIPLTAKFKSGEVVITPGAESNLDQDDVLIALIRHFRGDWGELSEFDRNVNDAAVEHYGQIHSRYRCKKGRPFWIVTEADRSVTTILLPKEH